MIRASCNVVIIWNICKIYKSNLSIKGGKVIERLTRAPIARDQ